MPVPSRRLLCRPLVECLETRQLLDAPRIDAIGSQSIPAGRTLHVPVRTSYDGADKPRFSATSTSNNFTVSFRPGSNTWIRMETSKGAMTFQLFDDTAPDTVQRMLGLIKSGFFDGLTFHRIVPNFVIQGGDPAGDGTGGPTFRFDDEFNGQSLFTGSGQLAMANSGKDTNGSQFFITAGQARFLDFNHTVWGQLVRGADVRDDIIDDPANEDGTPNAPIRINRVSVIRNRTDAVLIIRSAAAAQTGEIRVTANSDEGSRSVTFTATGVGDAGQQGPNNTPPALSPLSDLTVARNRTLQFRLRGFDVDSAQGNDLEYAAELLDKSQGVVSFTGNRVTFTPRQDFVGRVRMLVGVKQLGAQDRGSTQNPFDFQEISIGVGDKPLSDGRIVDGLAIPAGAEARNVVVATFTDTDSTGVVENFNVGINWGDDTVESGRVVKNANGSFSVLGDHTYRRAADTMPIRVEIVGDKGARLRISGTASAPAAATLAGGTLTVNGSSGRDVIGVSSRDGFVRANVNGVIRRFSASEVQRVVVNGLAGNDQIGLGTGVPAASIFGGGGNDTITGGNGNDSIDGGAGNDSIIGGNGNDSLLGGSGADRVFGNAGNDRLTGGLAADVLDGGAGTDSADNDAADTRTSIELLI